MKFLIDNQLPLQLAIHLRNRGHDCEHVLEAGLDEADDFSWHVWVSLSRQNMKRMLEAWERSGREAEPPCFGWLSTSLPGYPDTVNLKTNVHTCQVGVRPRIELEPTDHPLAREQREGISWKRVLEINSLAQHGHKG